MKLYHGTSIRSHASTLKHGLRPRRQDSSNWNANPSHPEMVYLTTAYPFYFATMSQDEPKVVVYEIDARKLDDSRLYPDEDFVVAYAEMHRDTPLTEEQKHHICADLDMFQHLWPKSLAALGNCAYRGTIPSKAITRYCLFDSAVRPDLTFHCMDASISVLNYRFEGKQREQVVSWFFEDRKLLPMVDEADSDEEREFWLAQSKDRSGIIVVDKAIMRTGSARRRSSIKRAGKTKP